jgi:NADPH:quinone reductase-like Zn-dependent oxidoreductase
MKAFVRDRFGSPDVLRLEEVDRPVPGSGEVLVRVRATSVQPADWHSLRGEPRVARLMGMGLRVPKLRILGADVAGVVEAVGPGVTGFSPGDEVFAMVEGGGFAEYVSVPAGDLAPKPRSLTFEQAAAVPLAAMTALLAVRDKGMAEQGRKVLVNGASGGVGTFAVQLALAFGAEPVGVCGPDNVELVRSLGAADVIDYTTEDFTRSGRQYDLIVDIAGSHGVWGCRRALTAKGICAVVGGPAGRWLQPAGHMVAGPALSPLISQRIVMVDVIGSKQRKENLETLTELIEKGLVTPVVARRYSFEEIPQALAYQEQGHAPGKVVVTLPD